MARKAENIEMPKKHDTKFHKVVNNLKPGWMAPDGGWGWVIVVATGLSNVFAGTLMVCFGLIFRERLQQFGISPAQTTTLINVNAATGSFVGLVNGPLFRKYTFRQVAAVSGFCISGAICTLAFMKTFYSLMFFYSIVYASGVSVMMSAGALSVIPYFVKKRRIAVGFSWAFSGSAHIVSPQVTRILMSIYGAFGTIIILGGMALHCIVCAVLLQPVQMNAKRSTEYENIKTDVKEHDEKSTGKVIDESKIINPNENVRNRGKHHDQTETLPQRFGSQYLHNNNEENELETPLMDCTKDNGETDANDEAQVEITTISENLDDNGNHGDNGYEIVDVNNDRIEHLLKKGPTVTCREVEDQKEKKLSWWSDTFRAVVAFFDLDLLRDCTYINMMIGVSLVFIIEFNYILLMPFIFADYGLTNKQVALMMSVGGIVDVSTRLIISVISSHIAWENRTFMFIGVGISALGHAALAHVRAYYMILGVAILCSIGKGISIVFSALVLPDYVSLEKLPAAIGLQLMTRGILFFAFGPVMGGLREISGSYTIPLHCLNIFSYYIIISAFIERCCCSPKKQASEKIKEANV